MVKPSLKAKRAKYRRDLEAALNRIRDQLAAMPEVEKIILFGSYAAGRRDLFTDLDLLVVMVTDQDYVQRIAELYARLQVDVDLDLLVYTPEELKQRRHTGFVQHALTTGRVIYEKNPL